MEHTEQAFKAVSRICLNNWHYIDQKVLSLNEGINFFTGHSGSGKSTVIDALQIVLYANTDGRSFFNKAAADDSDRSLMEYLRGMVNIGDNGQAEYKRNRSFSSTIVLELEQTFTGEKECVGIVFDVDVTTNEYSRLFFWHKGGIAPQQYRTGERVISIQEMKNYLQNEYDREDYFFTANSERFRRSLYDVYLGGLDMEKFPRLFKRAIPFKMNIRLEDFVKEYICMEQDIHIEDMQESVVLYGRMRRRIEEARAEIGELEEIDAQYESYHQAGLRAVDFGYRRDRLLILQLEQAIEELGRRVEAGRADMQLQQKSLEELQIYRIQCQDRYDEINRQIAGSGYADLETKLADLEDNLLLLERSRRKWSDTAARLEIWETQDCISNQILWDIDKFRKENITGQELERLKAGLLQVRQEAEKQRQEAVAEARGLQKEVSVLEQDLTELRLGKKAYPKELEAAQREIRRGLYEKLGKDVPVRVLADLLDIRDEKWRNAIEGYLGSNKLALIVEPKFVRDALEVYEGLEDSRFFRVSLVDTEKLMEQEHSLRPGSLAEEVQARESYVKAYVNYLLGNVVKCADTKELRAQRTGVTADCLLYQNFQLRRMNPDNYTRKAYIGEKSMRERQKELRTRLDGLRKKLEEHLADETAAETILSLESLNASSGEYLELLRDMDEHRKKESQKKKLLAQMEEIGSGIVESLKKEREETAARQTVLDRQMDALKLQIHDRERDIENGEKASVMKNEEWVRMKRQLCGSQAQEEAFEAFLIQETAGKSADCDKLLRRTEELIRKAEAERAEAKDTLVDIRSAYLKNHPNREFSASGEHNEDYRGLLAELKCDRIQEFEEKAGQQAKVAVEHFKEDFVFKIRSAIKEAFLRRDELNRIIRNLNFGKDRYQFKITRNKGSFGKYYDMFMDESLQVDPSSLSDSVDHQMDMFSMEHENRYGEVMNDLIHIFIPPESANARELEEARLNMEKYADYRTYLSFEMEQIVEGEERLVIGLSRMIKKNSGGEGQNPLYVALLASFAQAYRISQSPKPARRPTMRLVILDEAFSKMDAEKVASCIELIRGLGFQAIISATNDKIQNYLENVDKTFVYANPNKKSISIQEFEKKDFRELLREEEN